MASQTPMAFSGSCSRFLLLQAVAWRRFASPPQAPWVVQHLRSPEARLRPRVSSHPDAATEMERRWRTLTGWKQRLLVIY